MEGYFYGLLGACLFCGVCGLLAPEGTIQRTIRLLGGLSVLCVILSPLPDVIDFLKEKDFSDHFFSESVDSSNYDEIYNQTLHDAGAAQMSEYLQKELVQRLSLKETDLSVQVEWKEGEEGYEWNQIWVTLRGSAVVKDPNVILSFVEERCSCSCIIVYE